MAHRDVSNNYRDKEKEGWERSDFPIVCETCLGDNPYVRMQKLEFDKECKVCSRPFTVFRWKAGTEGRFKKTEICQTCAKLKNVCQTCLLDLEFGLPVQIRDMALPANMVVTMPESDAGRAYFAQIADRMVQNDQLPYYNADYTSLAYKLLRSAPYYQRNKAHVCTFWLRGTCTRGELCPFRHEEDHHDPALKDQNIKDRYYGNNDPVALKMLNRLKSKEAATGGGSNQNTVAAAITGQTGGTPDPKAGRAAGWAALYPSMNPMRMGTAPDPYPTSAPTYPYYPPPPPGMASYPYPPYYAGYGTAQPASQPKQPTAQPKQPAAQPKQSAAQPKQPATQPTQSTQSTQSATQANQSAQSTSEEPPGARVKRSAESITEETDSKRTKTSE